MESTQLWYITAQSSSDHLHSFSPDNSQTPVMTEGSSKTEKH